MACRLCTSGKMKPKITSKGIVSRRNERKLKPNSNGGQDSIVEKDKQSPKINLCKYDVNNIHKILKTGNIETGTVDCESAPNLEVQGEALPACDRRSSPVPKCSSLDSKRKN